MAEEDQESIDLKQTLKRSRQELAGDAAGSKPTPPPSSDSLSEPGPYAPLGRPSGLSTQILKKNPLSSMSPQPEPPADSGAGEMTSDTVVLKVIREKKKKLAGVLSASQTLKLKNPANATVITDASQAPPQPGMPPPPPQPGMPPPPLGAPNSAAPPLTISPAPQPSVTPASEPTNLKETLRIRHTGPSASVSQSAPPTIQKPGLKIVQSGSPAGAPSAPVAPSGPPKLMVKGPAPTMGSAPPAAPHAPTAPSTDAESIKATLKIKVPDMTQGRSAPPPDIGPPPGMKATLKIKTPVASSAEDATSIRSSKTLKLKAIPQSADSGVKAASTASTAASTRTAATTLPKYEQATSQEEKPDIVYTFTAAASLFAIGGSIGLMIKQFSTLF